MANIPYKKEEYYIEIINAVIRTLNEVVRRMMADVHKRAREHSLASKPNDEFSTYVEDWAVKLDRMGRRISSITDKIYKLRDIDLEDKTNIESYEKEMNNF